MKIGWDLNLVLETNQHMNRKNISVYINISYCSSRVKGQYYHLGEVTEEYSNVVYMKFIVNHLYVCFCLGLVYKVKPHTFSYLIS